MAAGGRIYCEQCGREVPLRPEGALHYCLGCRLYLCGACHDATSVRCFACQRSPATALRSAEGITAARAALRVLRQASVDLGRLRAAARGRSGPLDAEADRDDLALAQVRAAAAASAAEHALAHVAPRFAGKAESLRQEIMLVNARIGLLRQETERPGPESRAIAALAAWRALGVRRILRSQPPVLLAGIVVLVSVVSVLAVSLQVSPAPGSGRSATAPSAREDTAGLNPPSNPGPTPVPDATAAPSTAEHEFDELPMGSALDAGWSVSGSEGDVAVAAFPTAIDRSLQLLRGPRDVRLCRLGALGNGAHAAAVDFLFDPAVPPNARLLQLSTVGGDAELTTGEGGVLEFEARGRSVTVGQIEPMTWYRGELWSDGGGLHLSLLEVETGAQLFKDTLDPDAGLAGGDVCFELPAAAPADLFIDDLSTST